MTSINILTVQFLTSPDKMEQKGFLRRVRHTYYHEISGGILHRYKDSSVRIIILANILETT